MSHWSATIPWEDRCETAVRELEQLRMLNQIASGVIDRRYDIDQLAEKAGLSAEKVRRILNKALTAKKKVKKNATIPIGTKRPMGDGYIEIFAGYDYASARGGWMREHRYVMQEDIGRTLLSHEVVHHRNGVKNDNRLENLELLCSSTHHSCKTCPYLVELNELKSKLGLI